MKIAIRPSLVAALLAAPFCWEWGWAQAPYAAPDEGLSRQSHSPTEARKPRQRRAGGGFTGVLDSLGQDIEKAGTTRSVAPSVSPPSQPDYGSGTESKGIATTSTDRADGSRLVTRTDAAGNVISTAVYPPGRSEPAFVSSLDPSTGVVTTSTIAPDGTQVVSTSETIHGDGFDKVIETDNRGNRTETILPADGGAPTITETDANGTTRKITPDSDGGFTVVESTPDGYVTETKHRSDGSTVTVRHDLDGSTLDTLTRTADGSEIREDALGNRIETSTNGGLTTARISDRRGNTTTVVTDAAGNVVSKEETRAAPKDPGQEYYETVLGGTDWEKVPRSLRDKYTSSEQTIRDHAAMQALRAQQAADRRREDEEIRADSEARRRAMDEKLAAIEKAQDAADAVADKRTAMEKRQRAIEESHEIAKGLQRDYDAAVTRGDKAEAARIMAEQDRHAEASNDLLAFTDDERAEAQRKQEVRNRLVEEIVASARNEALTKVGQDWEQDLKESVTSGTKYVSVGSEMQQETKESTRRANFELAFADAKRQRIEGRLKDPGLSDEEHDILTDMLQLSSVQEHGAATQLSDNSKLTAAGYAIDVGMLASGGLANAGVALGAKVTARVAGEQTAKRLVSIVADRGISDLGKSGVMAATERLAGKETAEALAAKAAAAREAANRAASTLADAGRKAATRVIGEEGLASVANAGRKAVNTLSTDVATGRVGESKLIATAVEDMAVGATVDSGMQLATTGTVDVGEVVRGAFAGGVVAGGTAAVAGGGAHGTAAGETPRRGPAAGQPTQEARRTGSGLATTVESTPKAASSSHPVIANPTLPGASPTSSGSGTTGVTGGKDMTAPAPSRAEKDLPPEPHRRVPATETVEPPLPRTEGPPAAKRGAAVAGTPTAKGQDTRPMTHEEQLVGDRYAGPGEDTTNIPVRRDKADIAPKGPGETQILKMPDALQDAKEHPMTPAEQYAPTKLAKIYDEPTQIIHDNQVSRRPRSVEDEATQIIHGNQVARRPRSIEDEPTQIIHDNQVARRPRSIEDEPTQIIHENQSASRSEASSKAPTEEQSAGKKPRIVYPDFAAGKSSATPDAETPASGDRPRSESGAGVDRSAPESASHTANERRSDPEAPTWVEQPAQVSGSRGETPARIRNSLPPDRRPTFDESMAIADRLISQDPRFADMDRAAIARATAMRAGNMEPAAIAALALNYHGPEGARITPETLSTATGLPKADAERMVQQGWDDIRVDPGDIHHPGPLQRNAGRQASTVSNAQESVGSMASAPTPPSERPAAGAPDPAWAETRPSKSMARHDSAQADTRTSFRNSNDEPQVDEFDPTESAERKSHSQWAEDQEAWERAQVAAREVLHKVGKPNAEAEVFAAKHPWRAADDQELGLGDANCFSNAIATDQRLAGVEPRLAQSLPSTGVKTSDAIDVLRSRFKTAEGKPGEVVPLKAINKDGKVLTKEVTVKGADGKPVTKIRDVWLPGPASRDQIIDALKVAGDGARGIVAVTYKPDETGFRDGHAFNVVNHKGEVVFVDGQSGSIASPKIWRKAAQVSWIRTDGVAIPRLPPKAPGP